MIEIDIDGPQGNAYALMGIAKSTGEQLGFSSEKNSQIFNEMMSGDYNNLLLVFMNNFGQYYKLVNKSKENNYEV